MDQQAKLSAPPSDHSDGSHVGHLKGASLKKNAGRRFGVAPQRKPAMSNRNKK
jgi:hypothetical protein